MGEADPKDQDNNNVNNQGSNHEMTGGLQDGAGTTDVTDLGGSFLDSFKVNPKNLLVGAAISPVMGAGLAKSFKHRYPDMLVSASPLLWVLE